MCVCCVCCVCVLCSSLRPGLVFLPCLNPQRSTYVGQGSHMSYLSSFFLLSLLRWTDRLALLDFGWVGVCVWVRRRVLCLSCLLPDALLCSATSHCRLHPEEVNPDVLCLLCFLQHASVSNRFISTRDWVNLSG